MVATTVLTPALSRPTGEGDYFFGTFAPWRLGGWFRFRFLCHAASGRWKIVGVNSGVGFIQHQPHVCQLNKFFSAWPGLCG